MVTQTYMQVCFSMHVLLCKLCTYNVCLCVIGAIEDKVLVDLDVDAGHTIDLSIAQCV